LAKVAYRFFFQDKRAHGICESKEEGFASPFHESNAMIVAEKKK